MNLYRPFRELQEMVQVQGLLSSGEGERKENNIANMFARIFPQAAHVFAPIIPTGIIEFNFDLKIKFLIKNRDTIDVIFYGPEGTSVTYDASVLRTKLE